LINTLRGRGDQTSHGAESRRGGGEGEDGEKDEEANAKPEQT
jgi:hypothetical protein